MDDRLGADEDNDGDLVYGTIQGALEAIDHNGKVVVVTSGIFNENVYIGQQFAQIAPFGALNPGHVTLEAAPGVEAVIDAFSLNDAVANNNARAEIVRTHVTDTCYRIAPVSGPPCSPGHGIFANNNTFLRIYDSVVSKNGGDGVFAALTADASGFNLVTQLNGGTPHSGLDSKSVIYDF